MNLPTLEFIGSGLVLLQALFMAPAVYRLWADGRVEGMSLWTMGFYCFVSWFYVPISVMADLTWTAGALVAVGLVELIWCVWAATLIIKEKNNDHDSLARRNPSR